MKKFFPIPRFKGYSMNRDGIAQTPRGSYRYPYLTTSGYMLTLLDTGLRGFTHRLLWETFRGPIPRGMHINHKNCIKSDNRLSNLEVVTPLQNARHYRRKREEWGKNKPWHDGVIEGQERRSRNQRLADAAGLESIAMPDGRVLFKSEFLALKRAAKRG